MLWQFDSIASIYVDVKGPADVSIGTNDFITCFADGHYSSPGGNAFKHAIFRR